MRELKDMTNEELYNYCVDKKKKGVPFREFHRIFEKSNADKDTIKAIMAELEDIDKVQQVELRKQEKLNKKKSGIKNIIIT